jgi:hypothetical protein
LKKVILVFASIVLVISGVAAVSAYEAHIVNVKAHVENALTVTPLELDWETVFPQEWFKEHVTISLSESAMAATNSTITTNPLTSVSYAIWVEDKLMVEPDTYYPWIGDWLWVAVDPTQQAVPFEVPADWYYVGPRPAGPAPIATNTGLTGTLSLNNMSDQLAVLFCAPVFEGYYNELTDADYKPDWWPYEEWAPIATDDPRHIPDGVDLGIDIKIQVTDITRS